MKVALALIVLVAYFAQGEAVTCWTCDEEDITKCDTSEQETCDGKCMKIVGSGLGITIISRSCSSVCADANTSGNGMHCCDSDLCNAATTTSSVFAFTLAASVMALIYNRM